MVCLAVCSEYISNNLTDLNSSGSSATQLLFSVYEQLHQEIKNGETNQNLDLYSQKTNIKHVIYSSLVKV